MGGGGGGGFIYISSCRAVYFIVFDSEKDSQADKSTNITGENSGYNGC